MTPPSSSNSPEKPSLTQRIVPFIASSGPCFVVTYSLVLAGVIGLLATAVITSQLLFLWLALWLVASSVLGLIAPLYPVGILAVFNAGTLIIMTCHYGMIQHGTAHSPTTAVVHKLS